jgi:uncharacterized protein DUF2784
MTSSPLVELSSAILWLHLCVVAFAVFGLVAIPLGAWAGWGGVRVRWWRALHLGVLGIVAVQAVLGRACFLTIWQSELLRQAGRAAADEPLIEGWVRKAIYWPLPLWFFAGLYGAVCLYALLLWRLVPPRPSG